MTRLVGIAAMCVGALIILNRSKIARAGSASNRVLYGSRALRYEQGYETFSRFVGLVVGLGFLSAGFLFLIGITHL